MEVLVAVENGQPVPEATVARTDATQIRRTGETIANGIWRGSQARTGNYRAESAGAEAVTCHVKAGEVARCELVVEGCR